MQTRTLLAGLAALTFGGAASAALITASAVTDNGTTDGAITPSKASDGDSSSAGLWYTPDPGGYPSDYFASGGTSPILTFTFTGPVTLDAIAFWGHGFNAPNNNSVQVATMEFRNGGSSIETVNFNPANAGNLVQQDFDLQDDLGLSTNTVTVDEIVLTISDNYYNGGDPNAGGDRVGLAEIQFNQVPEPGSLALLGLGGLMIARRRRG